MKLSVTMQRCAGCNRVAMGRAREEWCPDSKRMERQITVVYYHRFLVAFSAGVGVLLGVIR